MNVNGLKHGLAFCLLITVIFTTCTSSAATTTNTITSCKINSTSEPRQVEYSWMSLSSWYQQHAEDIKVANEDHVDVLFIGDSITAAWPYDIWAKHYAQYNAANFAIGGDTTQNVLWRLQHGAAQKLTPKVVNVLIGVNNMGLAQETPRQTYCGIVTLVDATLRLYPDAKILLNQLLPWGQSPEDKLRGWVNEVNHLLAQHAFSPRVTLFQFGSELLDKNGKIAPSIMADYLHPTEQGYKIYARHLAPKLKQLLSQNP